MSATENSSVEFTSFEPSPHGTPKVYIWGEVILFIMGILGIALNAFVLYFVFVRRKASLASDTVLMGLITIADLIACLFTTVSQPLITFEVAKNVEVRCWSDILIFSTTTFASLSITSVLSMVRYLSLVRGWKISWKKSLYGSMFFLVLVCSVIFIRGLIDGLSIMPSGLYCMPHTDKPERYSEVFEIIYALLLLPCPFIIIFCYAAVGFRYRDVVEKGANDAVRSACSELGNLPTIQNQMRESFIRFHRKRLIKLGIVIVSYAIALVPEYVLSISAMFLHSSRTSLQDTVSFLFMFSLAIINPFFVLHLHKASDSQEDHIELKGDR